MPRNRFVPRRQEQIAVAREQVENGAGDTGKRINAGHGTPRYGMRNVVRPSVVCAVVCARSGRASVTNAMCALMPCTAASRRSVASSSCCSRSGDEDVVRVCGQAG